MLVKVSGIFGVGGCAKQTVARARNSARFTIIEEPLVLLLGTDAIGLERGRSTHAQNVTVG